MKNGQIVVYYDHGTRQRGYPSLSCALAIAHGKEWLFAVPGALLAAHDKEWLFAMCLVSST